MGIGEPLLILSLMGGGLLLLFALLAARNFGWLSLCPRIDDDGTRVIAQTGWLPWLLALTHFYRAVTIDGQMKEVFVSRLLAWVWSRTRRIAFDEIAAVIYHFEEGTMTVALRLISGEEVHLFYFWGPFDDSGRERNEPDEASVLDLFARRRRSPYRAIPWGRVFEQRDYSERTALAFAERLQEMTGKPLTA